MCMFGWVIGCMYVYMYDCMTGGGEVESFRDDANGRFPFLRKFWFFLPSYIRANIPTYLHIYTHSFVSETASTIIGRPPSSEIRNQWTVS